MKIYHIRLIKYNFFYGIICTRRFLIQACVYTPLHACLYWTIVFLLEDGLPTLLVKVFVIYLSVNNKIFSNILYVIPNLKIIGLCPKVGKICKYRVLSEEWNGREESRLLQRILLIDVLSKTKWGVISTEWL